MYGRRIWDETLQELRWLGYANVGIRYGEGPRGWAEAAAREEMDQKRNEVLDMIRG